MYVYTPVYVYCMYVCIYIYIYYMYIYIYIYHLYIILYIILMAAYINHIYVCACVRACVFSSIPCEVSNRETCLLPPVDRCYQSVLVAVSHA